MNVDCPNATEGDQAREGFQGKTENERGQIDKAQGVNRVEWVFAVRSEPVEMRRAVMDRMEPPEKANAMLQAMAPIDKEVAQQDDFDRLGPPGLECNGVAESVWHDPVKPVAGTGKHPEDETTPQEILTEEKTEVG